MRSLPATRAGRELSAARRALYASSWPIASSSAQPPVDAVNGNDRRMREGFARRATSATSSATTRARRARRGFQPPLPRQPSSCHRAKRGGYEAGNRQEGRRPARPGLPKGPWPLPRSSQRDRGQDRDRDRQGEGRPQMPERQQRPAEAAGGEPQQPPARPVSLSSPTSSPSSCAVGAPRPAARARGRNVPRGRPFARLTRRRHAHAGDAPKCDS